LMAGEQLETHQEEIPAAEMVPPMAEAAEEEE
jgi:hypothetical protein